MVSTVRRVNPPPRHTNILMSETVIPLLAKELHLVGEMELTRILGMQDCAPSVLMQLIKQSHRVDIPCCYPFLPF